MDKSTRKLMTMHKALHLRDNIDNMFQEKKDEEYLLAMWIVKMHHFKDSKNTLKRTKK